VRLPVFRPRFVGIDSPFFRLFRAPSDLWFARRRTGRRGDILVMQKMPRELRFVEPMECKPVESLPEDHNWQYEIKFDGYRAIAIKQRGEVQLFSRRGNSFTSTYPGVVDALGEVRTKSFILDGEIVALDDQGRHSFSLLQKRTSKKLLLHFYAFDLLHLEGKDLMKLPLRRRREQLEERFSLAADPLRISPVLTGSLDHIAKTIRQFEFEGIVAKRLDSPYKPGEESGTWLKIKLQRSEDFLIGGYIPGAHGVDQLVVGIQKEDRFLYVESVKNGFVPTARRLVQDAIERLHIQECPFDNLPEKKARFAMDREKMRKVRWVKPKIRCEVAFNEWTENGHLRHSRFVRLRAKWDTRASIE
jgi:DNA ligase D-like protein (predicted ligase)